MKAPFGVLEELTSSIHGNYESWLTQLAAVLISEGMSHLEAIMEAIYKLKPSFNIVCKVLAL